MTTDAINGGGQDIGGDADQQGGSNTNLLDKQRDVQRKRGRCLLLLQQ